MELLYQFSILLDIAKLLSKVVERVSIPDGKEQEDKSSFSLFSLALVARLESLPVWQVEKMCLVLICIALQTSEFDHLLFHSLTTQVFSPLNFLILPLSIFLLYF